MIFWDVFDFFSKRNQKIEMLQMTQKSKKQLKIEIVKKVEKMTLPHSYRRMAGILIHAVYKLFPAPWCGIAIVTWVRTYRDSVGARSCWNTLPVESNHHRDVCHRVPCLDMGLISSAKRIPRTLWLMMGCVWTTMRRLKFVFWCRGSAKPLIRAESPSNYFNLLSAIT